jgi:hypothetical protein
VCGYRRRGGGRKRRMLCTALIYCYWILLE